MESRSYKGISSWISPDSSMDRRKSLSLVAFTSALQISGTRFDRPPMHPFPPEVMLYRYWSSKPEYVSKECPLAARQMRLVWLGSDTESLSPAILGLASSSLATVEGAMEYPVLAG